MKRNLVSSLLLYLIPVNLSVALVRQYPLQKPFTIHLPMVAPIGGTINPMGDICTESVDMLLARVNNQTKILPQHNLVIELIDDECSDAVALRRALPYLQNWRVTSNLHSQDYAINSTIPSSPVIQSGTAITAYTPPFLVGAICSSACKVVGKLPQHFNLINIATACIDPALDERKKYPNFYRLYRSVRDTSYARVNLLSTMKWSKIAILCDTTQYTYQDSVFFMKVLQQHSNDVEIVAEEFFQDNPSEAIGRLKSVEARVIFAICYVNVCPAIACAAFSHGYYGPNVVWIFNSEVDLLSKKINRPPGCEPWMTDAFVEGSFFMGIDLTATTFKNQVSEIGFTAGEVTDYIRQRSPNSLNTGAAEWRLLCFELAHNAVFIVDAVERKLREKGDTLVTVINDPLRLAELREMFRDATLTLDISATWGRSVFQQNSTTMAYSSPLMMVQQVQKGIRQGILVLKTSATNFAPISNSSSFIWRTSDRQAPKSEAAVVIQRLAISEQVIGIIRSIASLLLTMATMCILALVYLRKRENYINSFTKMNVIIVAGTISPLLAIFIYQESSSSGLFCSIAPILVVFGYLLSVGGLVMKILTKYIFKMSGPLSHFLRVQRQALAGLLLWVLLNMGFAVVLYSGDGILQEVTVIQLVPSKTIAPETIVKNSWTMCSSKDFTFGWIMICLQVLLAVSGIIVGLITKNLHSGILISDIGATRICFFVAFPLSVTLVLAMQIMYTYSVQFAALATHAICHSSVVIATIGFAKLRKEPLPQRIGASIATRMSIFSQRRSSTSVPLAMKRSATAVGTLSTLVHVKPYQRRPSVI